MECLREERDVDAVAYFFSFFFVSRRETRKMIHDALLFDWWSLCNTTHKWFHFSFYSPAPPVLKASNKIHFWKLLWMPSYTLPNNCPWYSFVFWRRKCGSIWSSFDVSRQSSIWLFFGLTRENELRDYAIENVALFRG